MFEEVLQAHGRKGFISAAKASTQFTLGWYERTGKAVKDTQKTGSFPSLPLQDYVGTWWSRRRYIKLEVTLEDEKLSWALQGFDQTSLSLVTTKMTCFPG